VQLNNVIKVLGLSECANTLVGDGAIRGISGGQKRRVTLGEMLMPPRSIRYMDAISNGLDAATTFDIIQALRLVTRSVGLTTVVSLLQVRSLRCNIDDVLTQVVSFSSVLKPAPDVFYSFEDVIVMADGQIIYHGMNCDAAFLQLTNLAPTNYPRTWR
jgi:ABC-type Mn2+/Zn2+ transport system ATPase subunit